MLIILRICLWNLQASSWKFWCVPHTKCIKCMTKSSRAISRVKWLSGEKKKKKRFEDHLCPRPIRPVPEDEDTDGLWNVGFFTVQPFDPAESPRELRHTQSSGKQQISLHKMYLQWGCHGCQSVCSLPLFSHTYDLETEQFLSAYFVWSAPVMSYIFVPIFLSDLPFRGWGM
jgi:hypothetical protein